MLSNRENYLRAIEFRYPEWIPCSVGFAPIVWKMQGRELEKVILDHPRLFPGYQEGSANFYEEMPVVYREGQFFTDNWGCLWHNIQEGLEGQVVGHPLANWEALKDYKAPDYRFKTERGERNWEAIEKYIREQKQQGGLVGGDGERLFDRLYFLRGFENLMMDFAIDDPRLPELIALLEGHEMKLIEKYLSFGVDVMYFHTDIGTQAALMISPAKFRQYLKPMFMRLFQTCRKAGTHVYLSSDGHLLEIVDDLIECGVSVHDPQIRANTLDGIVKAYKGRMCANVDLDRQGFPFMTPARIREQVREVVDKMAAPEGGLMLSGSVWGNDVPLENIEALCSAVEDYCFP
ncbi:MAG: hypothetical protein IT210_20430 [Armatimonadetes bacterium]|nr:hypothetical protein [Armatimonadota bacterium]